MMQLTTEQRVFIVLHYTQHENTTAVKNAFRARFPNRNPEILSLLKSQGRNVFSTAKQANTHDY